MLLLESLHRHKNMPNDRNEYFYMNVRKITLCCQELLASDNRQSVNNVVSRLMIWLMYCVLAPFCSVHQTCQQINTNTFYCSIVQFLIEKIKGYTRKKRFLCNIYCHAKDATSLHQLIIVQHPVIKFGIYQSNKKSR